MLDKHFGIDCVIKLPNGMPVTTQEKTRQAYSLRRYDEYTLEYHNDPRTKEEGEWFHLVPDIYFYGFANEQFNGWLKWYILNVTSFKLAVFSGRVQMRGPVQNTKSRANFMWTKWADIPVDLLIARWPVPA